jgi:hypothetical protein
MYQLIKTIIVIFFIQSISGSMASAQMSLIGQVRTRSELRNGVGTLNLKDTSSTFFTSQRTRLTFGYKWDRITLSASVQDIRVWGQDASTISNSEGSRLMLHEGWADLILMNAKDSTIKAKWLESLSFKIGRQALNYDDGRLLGELDWAQQARRHDAAVLKAVHKGWQVDLGAAFNQNNDAFGNVGTAYVPGNVPAYVTSSNGTLVASPSGMIPLSGNGSVSAKSSKSGRPVLLNAPSTNGMNQEYKSVQFLYAAKSFGKTRLAGLLFKDDFSRYRLDSVGSTSAGFVYGRRYDQEGVNSRITYGALLSGECNALLKKVWNVGAYFQNGKDKDGSKLNAANYTASVLFQAGKLSFGPGFDYLSGDKPTTSAAESRRFDPLYPTAHKFWGYMDYFYVGTGSPGQGLQNAFFKLKYAAKTFAVGLDIHQFALANKIKGNESPGKNLGTELDLVANYILNKFTVVEFGYSTMAATKSLEFVKTGTLGRADLTPQWAYLSINIRPDFLAGKSQAR